VYVAMPLAWLMHTIEPSRSYNITPPPIMRRTVDVILGCFFFAATATADSSHTISASCCVATPASAVCGSPPQINMSYTVMDDDSGGGGRERRMATEGYAMYELNITDTMMFFILRQNDTIVGSTMGPSCEAFVSEFPSHNNKEVILIESVGLPCIMNTGDPVVLHTSVYMPNGHGEYELNIAIFDIYRNIACITVSIHYT
jgi:hypothetical protein